jgi:transcriptional regulator with XRE-family HTH domain
VIDAAALLHHRTLAGYSQRKLAKLAGVNAMTIKRLEDGADASELPLGVLGRIASALALKPGQLLTDANPCEGTAADSTGQLDESPLDHNAARLLRRIHRGDDVPRTMSRVERELVLPNLIRRGIVDMTPSGARVADGILQTPETTSPAPEGT